MTGSGWIDVHAHFYPPETDEVRHRRLVAMRETGWCTEETPVWSPGPTLASMDRAGVQMQMLSNIPKSLVPLRESNDYGASLLRTHPARFGFLMALPTDDAEAALAEIDRAAALGADGFAVTCAYNGVLLSDPRLDPVWRELDRQGATVFAHPDAYLAGSGGRPAALIDVAFETARVVVDMLYAGVFRRFPGIRFVLAHCGGALPALSGRLLLLGHEAWVPNPNRLTPAELREHLRLLFLDTAGTCPTVLGPALAMTTPDHLVYGSDCGVPCTTDATMAANRAALLRYPHLSREELEAIGRNALTLFPAAAARIEAAVP